MEYNINCDLYVMTLLLLSHWIQTNMKQARMWVAGEGYFIPIFIEKIRPI